MKLRHIVGAAFVALLSSLAVGHTSVELNEARSLMKSAETLPQATKLLKDALLTSSLSPTERDLGQFMLAECYYGEKLPQDAFWHLTRLSVGASSSSARVDALFRLAMLQMDQGLEQEGQATYGKIVSNFPTSDLASSALMIQGNYTLLVKGDKNRAVAIYEDVIRFYPKSKEAMLAKSSLPDLRKLSSAEVKEAGAIFVKEQAIAKTKPKKKKTNQKI